MAASSVCAEMGLATTTTTTKGQEQEQEKRRTLTNLTTTTTTKTASKNVLDCQQLDPRNAKYSQRDRSPCLGRFLCGSIFRASDFDPIAFSDVKLGHRISLPMRKNQIYCVCRDSSKHRDQLLFVLFGAAKRRAGCAALLVGPKRASQG